MTIPLGWSVAMDLGSDLAATEMDALYVESALVDAGVPVVIYPWHPSRDPFTPLGATRPYKVLVPDSHHGQARELVEDLIVGGGERLSALVPADDAWGLHYQNRVLVELLLGHSDSEGGVWDLALWGIRIYLAGLAVVWAGTLFTRVSQWFVGQVR